MLTVITSGPVPDPGSRHPGSRDRAESIANEVFADVVATAEEDRALRRDATAMVERLAARARTAGLEHPVAAAVAQAARISSLSGPEAFAERIGLPVARLVEAESGAVRFGELPVAYDASCGRLRLDLLSLADLEAAWCRADTAHGPADTASDHGDSAQGLLF